MFRIKMCGVTSPGDAILAVEAGADAVGINFFRESVRYVAPEAAGPIVEAIRERATAVAVFVNENPDRIAEICGKLGIGVVQLSGHEPAAGAARIRYPVIKAVHMENEAGLEAFRDYPCRAFLFDASLPGEYGGTGKPLDWEALGRTTGGPLVRFGKDGSSGSGRPWMLAGGLTPENVAGAIRAARPFGVDVASGVEAAPGKKDPGKMKAFVDRARGGFGIAGIGG
ncbi:MAG TPA: phosphoribosylanthranilate isomerase [Candidatus Limnocylindria bacterium]|nr:phosphoribosylanthranilate isomerase [Candidatus Limnocylindria bacterium]